MGFATPDPHPNLRGFSPDLIDRTKTPTYVVQPDPEGNQDVCILRIKGGPPYEDIAFKVPWLGLRVRVGVRVRVRVGVRVRVRPESRIP